MDNAEGDQANQVLETASPNMQALINQIKTQAEANANIQQELRDRKEVGGTGSRVKVKQEDQPDPSASESSSEAETESKEGGRTTSMPPRALREKEGEMQPLT